ncbi:MAG: hypothetical protein RIQ81_2125 [Pseudomonadota bacterium]|jgi:heme/copper-type cytochrome/quinol oxidase subunit 4
MSSHAAGHSHGEKEHASVKLYIVFAVILCVITFMEWWIFKKKDALGISNQVLVISLIAMSLIKFAMVCGWYMHLRYDNKVLTNMLLAGMVMASATFLVLHFVVHPKECDALKPDCFRIGETPAAAPDAAPSTP